MKFSLRPWSSRLIVAIAIGAAVWALRVALIGDLGIGVPYWDQWDREGLIIYEPWIAGKLTWHALFEPHLEHRIVWTHLWNLALLELCGQWDPVVQMVAQVVFPAATAGGCVWGLLTVRNGLVWRWSVAAGAVVAFGFPFAYGNILWGFQSSFGMLVAVSLVACAATARVWNDAWWGWLALAAGLMAPLAMGAGTLIGPIIVALSIVVILSIRKITCRSGTMVVLGLICFLWGMFWRSDSTVMAFARAESVHRFLVVWLASVAWPNFRVPGLALLACLPMAILAIRTIRRKAVPQPPELFLIGIAIWAVGCAAGGAWTRGGVDPIPPSRYADFLTPLCLVNWLAMIWVAQEWGMTGVVRWRKLGIALTILWGGAAFYGGIGLLGDFFVSRRAEIAATNARQFESVNRVLSGDPVDLMIRAGIFPKPTILEKAMTSEVLASFLPPELQAPPRNLTEDNALAFGLTGSHAEWDWRGGEFVLRKSAMIAFVRGDPLGLDLLVLDLERGKEVRFKPTGRHIGDWSEWLVRTSPGPHRIAIKVGPSAEGLAILLPRPVSAVGYWARYGAAQTSALCGFAVIALAIAMVVSVRGRMERG